MKQHEIVAAVATAFTVGVCAGGVRQSENYRITADVFTQGGGAAVVQSAAFRLSASVGQRSVVAGSSTGGTVVLISGFQACLYAAAVGGPDDAYESWAAESGLPEGRRAPDDDYDEDGFTNWQEYVADTDPTEKDSKLQVVSFAQTGTETTVSFVSSAARTYELLFTADLVNGPWTTVIGPRAGIGGPDGFVHAREGPVGFYRIKVSLP